MPDDWDDEDWYDEADEPDDAEAAGCPECGGLVYGLADKCPACGYWLTAADRRAMGSETTRTGWAKFVAAVIIVLFVACLLLAGWRIF